MKKKLMPPYEVATLRRTGYRTYIEFSQTNPASGLLVRFRPTFNLNRKKYKSDEKALLARAAELIALINASLPFGYPYSVGLLSMAVVAQMAKPATEKARKQKKQPANEPHAIMDAVNKALRLKCRSASDETIRTYTSTVKIFAEWVARKGWAGKTIDRFKIKQALAFMDHVEHERKGRAGGQVAARTYNGYLRDLRALWAEMVKRKICDKNPFGPKHFKYKEADDLLHEVLTVADARILFAHLFENDKTIFYAILIQYVGFARPNEIYDRLRRRHIDAEAGLIEVPGKAHSKTAKTKYLTIPTSFLHYFKDEWLEAIPPEHLIWGKTLHPHATEGCGWRSVYNRYATTVKELHRAGKIAQCSTKLYDWKRRGITDFIQIAGLRSAQRQAGHRKVESTILYDKPGRVNTNMQNVPNLMQPCEVQT